VRAIQNPAKALKQQRRELARNHRQRSFALSEQISPIVVMVLVAMRFSD
jgi:hypothetical protein